VLLKFTVVTFQSKIRKNFNRKNVSVRVRGKLSPVNLIKDIKEKKSKILLILSIEMNLIDAKEFETLSPFFRGEKGHRRAEFIMRMFAFDEVNKLYDRSAGYMGAEFAASLLNDLGVHYDIGNAERLQQMPEGAFITIANHPYGGLDGIMLIDLMAGIRPDYRLMVNRILYRVKAMKENFICVTPAISKKNGITATSINGIRETMKLLHDGHPVGFFPSGAVSDFSFIALRIRDRKWQESILHLIRSAKVPILPIRFFDTNSLLFYFMGVINWRIRLFRLPNELFNKRGRKHRLSIGNIISVKEQEEFTDVRSLGAFLRKTVYEMPVPDSFKPRTIINLPAK
jgi:putative hemolysin